MSLFCSIGLLWKYIRNDSDEMDTCRPIMHYISDYFIVFLCSHFTETKSWQFLIAWFLTRLFIVLQVGNRRFVLCVVPDKLYCSWWRHQMETFSALLALCAGNSPVAGESPAQRPVTRSFEVFFDLRLNGRLSKQSGGWWFETPSRPLWRHSNVLSLCRPWVGKNHIPVTQLLTLHRVGRSWRHGK